MVMSNINRGVDYRKRGLLWYQYDRTQGCRGQHHSENEGVVCSSGTGSWESFRFRRRIKSKAGTKYDLTSHNTMFNQDKFKWPGYCYIVTSA